MAHDVRYDAAQNLGTRTLTHPPAGTPVVNDHALAAETFARQEDDWTADQTEISAIGFFPFAPIDQPQNNWIKARLKRAGANAHGLYRELKFLDKNGIDRTAGSKLRLPTRHHSKKDDATIRNDVTKYPALVGQIVDVWQYDRNTNLYVRDKVGPFKKRLLKAQMHVSFRPMLPETEQILQAYIEGHDANFANVFLGQGAVGPPTTRAIMDDLKFHLTEGPLFNMQTTKLIMDNIYNQLQRGVHIDTDLFKVGVEVLTNNILTNMFKPHHLRDEYKVEAVPVRQITQSVPLATQDILYTIAAPTGGTIEENVYRQALTVSLVTEASLAAADKVDEANQDHAKHVAIGVSFALASVKAILVVAPLMNVGAAVTEFFDPIKEAILYKTEKKYTRQKIRDVVEREYAKLRSDAVSGYIVPGLNNRLAVRNLYQASVGQDNVTHFVHQERRAWGTEFLNAVEVIRPYGR